jgi:NDP-sugar pyrophosphorylase family protein
MNGDSFLDITFRDLLQTHRSHDGLVTMAVLRVDDGQRYGRVTVNCDWRVTGFQEKTGDPSPAIISAGIYVFRQEIFRYIPEGASSLERDIFPEIVNRGIYAVEQNKTFIDIGTPEDYARAQTISDRLHGAVPDGNEE